MRDVKQTSDRGSALSAQTVKDPHVPTHTPTAGADGAQADAPGGDGDRQGGGETQDGRPGEAAAFRISSPRKAERGQFPSGVNATGSRPSTNSKRRSTRQGRNNLHPKVRNSSALHF